MARVIVLDTDAFLDDERFRRAYRQMSASRQEKIHRLRRPADQRLSLGAGVALEAALGPLGLRQREVAFSLGEKGKPYLRDRREVRFNLSHSGHYAVCALSDEMEVGVDIEEIGREKDALLDRVCAPGERARLRSLSPGERDERFFQLWTGKESFVKLLGTGLSLDLRHLEMDLEPALSIRRDGVLQPVGFCQWRLEGYWLTLCAPAPGSPDLTVLTREELEAVLDRPGGGLNPSG